MVDLLAGSTGLEPATSGLTVQCANQAAPRARDGNASLYHAGSVAVYQPSDGWGRPTRTSGLAVSAFRAAGRVARGVDDALRIAIHPVDRVRGQHVHVAAADGGQPLGHDVAPDLRCEGVQAVV